MGRFFNPKQCSRPNPYLPNLFLSDLVDEDESGDARESATAGLADRERERARYEAYAMLGVGNDGYDYSQHLREGGRPGGIFISASGKGRCWKRSRVACWQPTDGNGFLSLTLTLKPPSLFRIRAHASQAMSCRPR